MISHVICLLKTRGLIFKLRFMFSSDTESFSLYFAADRRPLYNKPVYKLDAYYFILLLFFLLNLKPTHALK